jgi:hypothetical protein
MLGTIRLIVGVLSLAALVGGLLLIVAGWVGGPAGPWLMVSGAVGLIGVAFERTRYHPEVEERAGGPGAAERDTADGRFRATDERFIDPTTRQPTRVWIDPRTGERRYRPDE